MRKSREEWRRLVGRWARSGLTAAGFAEKAGVNTRTTVVLSVPFEGRPIRT